MSVKGGSLSIYLRNFLFNTFHWSLILFNTFHWIFNTFHWIGLDWITYFIAYFIAFLMVLLGRPRQFFVIFLLFVNYFLSFSSLHLYFVSDLRSFGPT